MRQGLSVPEEVRNRLASLGETDIEHTWRVYFHHLRVLDTVYDRPYRTRYVTPGPVILPETEIIRKRCVISQSSTAVAFQYPSACGLEQWLYSVNHLVRQRQPLWPVCEPLWCCLFSGVLVCNLLWLILDRCCRWRVCVGFLVVAGRAPAETLCIHL